MRGFALNSLAKCQSASRTIASHRSELPFISTATPAFRARLQVAAGSVLPMARAIIRYSFDGEGARRFATRSASGSYRAVALRGTGRHRGKARPTRRSPTQSVISGGRSNTFSSAPMRSTTSGSTSMTPGQVQADLTIDDESSRRRLNEHMFAVQFGVQFERYRGGPSQRKPSRHGPLPLRYTASCRLGAGRSQVQILSPRLKSPNTKKCEQGGREPHKSPNCRQFLA